MNSKLFSAYSFSIIFFLIMMQKGAFVDKHCYSKKFLIIIREHATN